jgi:energy-coupling factor transporter ATP-binding protein EcfA2
MNSSLLTQISNNFDNLIIIGKAGVGKSTLIKVLKKTLDKQCVVVCPTGIAAQNVKGQTINSFFRIPPRNEMTSWELKNSGEKLAKLLESDLTELNTIIIDEISMVNQFVLESISSVLKVAKNNNSPFGGMRMILIGDLFQLPPVDIGGRIGDKIFFWHSKSYKLANFKAYELNQVYRQEENEENLRFLKTLDNVRTYKISQSDLILLNNKINSNINYIEQTVLCTKNEIAQSYNENGLRKLSSEEFHFNAETKGTWSKDDYPKDLSIKLKVGAPVLFMRNDPMGKYKNGTRGIVAEINPIEKKLKIRLNASNTIEVEYVTWAHPKYNKATEDETLIINDYFKHFPIILGYALTIHRCQGMTLDSVHLDLGTGAFAPGQLYVALSRLRNFSGLTLAKPITTTDVLSSQEIASFYQNIQPTIAQLNLSGSDLIDIDKHNETFVTSSGQKISTQEISRDLFRKGLDIEDILLERSRLGFKEVKPETIIGPISSKHEEFSQEELDRIIPISRELEESVVFQLKRMAIGEQTKLSEIKSSLIENEIDWNVLRLIGFRNDCFLGEESLKKLKEKKNKTEIIKKKEIHLNAQSGGYCKNCNKQLQGDKTKLLCYDCYKKIPKNNQVAISSQNAYKPWNNADDKRILQLKKNGYSNSLIAEELNRTTGAIASRLKKLNEL